MSAPAAAGSAPTASVPPVPAPRPPLSDLSDRGVTARANVLARRWTLRGTAKVSGDVRADGVELDGLLTVGGAFRVSRARLHGSAEISGPCEVANELETSGNLRCGGSLAAGALHASGRLRVTGEVTVAGVAEFKGLIGASSLAAGRVVLRGACEIPGVLRAAEVRLALERASSIGRIEGTRVELRLRPPNPVERVFGRKDEVRVDRIEAETVLLERVEVGFVRGREVHLGPEAHVTTVEGTVVERHRTSRLGPESRSPPPEGLRR
jgi:cytoskeletal protein CcmA (bactofilin family)